MLQPDLSLAEPANKASDSTTAQVQTLPQVKHTFKWCDSGMADVQEKRFKSEYVLVNNVCSSWQETDYNCLFASLFLRFPLVRTKTDEEEMNL